MVELTSGDGRRASGGDTSGSGESDDSLSKDERRNAREGLGAPQDTESETTSESKDSRSENQSSEEEAKQTESNRGEDTDGGPTLSERRNAREGLGADTVREDIAKENEGVEAEEIRVETDERGQITGAKLTESARNQRVKRQVASQRNNALEGVGAEDRAGDIQAQDLRVVTDDNGQVEGVRLTEDARRQRVKEQVAEQNENIDPEDVEVSFQENTPVSGGDARLANASGTDGDDLRRTTVGVSLSEEARRDILRERAREEYPNAEDIDIRSEDGELKAEIERESEVDSAIRSAQEIVDDPSRVVDGAVETGDAAVTGLQNAGEATYDAVTNPGDTVDATTEFVSSGIDRNAEALESTVDDAQYSLNNPGETIEQNQQAAETFISEGVDRNAEIADEAADAASNAARFVGTSFERFRGSGAGQAAVAAAPVAAAEPTPLGEVSVGAVVAGGTVLAAGKVAADEVTDTRSAQLTAQDSEIESPEGPVDEFGRTEVGLGTGVTVTEVENRPADSTELDPSEPTQEQSELGIADPRDAGGVTIRDGEVEIPAEAGSRETITITREREVVEERQEEEQSPEEMLPPEEAFPSEEEYQRELERARARQELPQEEAFPSEEEYQREIERFIERQLETEETNQHQEEVAVQQSREKAVEAGANAGATGTTTAEAFESPSSDTGVEEKFDSPEPEITKEIFEQDFEVGALAELDAETQASVTLEKQQQLEALQEQAVEATQQQTITESVEVTDTTTTELQEDISQPNVTEQFTVDNPYDPGRPRRPRRPPKPRKPDGSDRGDGDDDGGLFDFKFRNPVADPDEAVESFVGGDNDPMEDLDL